MRLANFILRRMDVVLLEWEAVDVHRILTRRFHLNLTHPRFMVTAPLV